ncbi:MAG: VCBS repeat-containing protein [Deltaproteobacteria bacterium]|nr:VCBS repeat-containing protein [Deltaproteobacteria bacterium]
MWSRTVAALAISMIATSASAEGGVVFDDIGTDLTYRRAHAANFPELTALLQGSLVGDGLEFATIPESLPGRVRGIPGLAVFDYDGDGDLDIYVTQGPGRAASLYSNQLEETGMVSFQDVAAAAGVTADDMDAWGVCYGDLDNDGDEDLIVTGNGEPNRLYVNNGAGAFDLALDSGLEGGSTNSTGCGVGDIDGDGLLDVSVVNNWDQQDFAPCFRASLVDEVQHNQLFRNTGNNTFADISTTSGIQTLVGNKDAMGNPLDIAGITWGHAMADVDLDGDIDILYADDQCEILPVEHGGPLDRGYVHVMLNDGSGSFEDHPVAEIPESSTTWMSIAFGDYDCDGNMDMFLSSFGDYAFNNIGVPNDVGDHSSRWVLGRGDGTFEDVGLGPELVGTPFGWGNAALDYDNDGDQDVVFIGGLDQLLVNQSDNPGALLSNQGCTASFSARNSAIPTDYTRHNVQGLAAGDFDGDGFTDFATASNLRLPDDLPMQTGQPVGGPFDATAAFFAAFAPTDATLAFWRWLGVEYGEGELTIEMNSGDNGNHWVSMTPVGTVGLTPGSITNRDGIGAVALVTPEGGHTVMRPVHVGNYTSAHAREGNFGLGAAPFASIEMRWQGGVRNKLFGVGHGEAVTFPEIPCSFDGSYGPGEYAQCLQSALHDIHQAGLISHFGKLRFFVSGMFARLEYLFG